MVAPTDFWIACGFGRILLHAIVGGGDDGIVLLLACAP